MLVQLLHVSIEKQGRGCPESFVEPYQFLPVFDFGRTDVGGKRCWTLSCHCILSTRQRQSGKRRCHQTAIHRPIRKKTTTLMFLKRKLIPLQCDRITMRTISLFLPEWCEPCTRR